MAIDDGAPRRMLSSNELADILRRAINEGELVPNQRLVETDLSAEYGASRGNVRAALSELTTEGLVERPQNHSARVRAVSVEEAVQITEVRAALEGLCARKAAARVSPAEAAELRGLAQRMADAVARGDREAYSECNRSFHAKIIQISSLSVAAATIYRLRSQAVRFQFQLARQRDRPNVSLPQHLAIIDAVCRRDPNGAAEAMLFHLESVAKAIRAGS